VWSLLYIRRKRPHGSHPSCDRRARTTPLEAPKEGKDPGDHGKPNNKCSEPVVAKLCDMKAGCSQWHWCWQSGFSRRSLLSATAVPQPITRCVRFRWAMTQGQTPRAYTVKSWSKTFRGRPRCPRKGWRSGARLDLDWTWTHGCCIAVFPALIIACRLV